MCILSCRIHLLLPASQFPVNFHSRTSSNSFMYIQSLFQYPSLTDFDGLIHFHFSELLKIFFPPICWYNEFSTKSLCWPSILLSGTQLIASLSLNPSWTIYSPTKWPRNNRKHHPIPMQIGSISSRPTLLPHLIPPSRITRISCSYRLVKIK